MKTVTITRRSGQLRELLAIAQDEDVVVQTKNGESFLVSLIDDFEYEVVQQRKNRKLMAFLKERFRQGRQEPGIPLEQVRRELGLSETVPDKRKKARRKTPRNHG